MAGTGLQPGRWGAQRDIWAPWPLASTILDLAGWGVARGNNPALGNVAWTCLPWRPDVGGSGMPVVNPAPFSWLCLCRVAEIAWIAGRVLPKSPAGFLFCGVTAGWGWGHRSFLGGWALSPLGLFCCPPPAPEQQRGGSSEPSQGLLFHPFPLEASQVIPEGPSCSDI